MALLPTVDFADHIEEVLDVHDTPPVCQYSRVIGVLSREQYGISVSATSRYNYVSLLQLASTQAAWLTFFLAGRQTTSHSPSGE